MSAESPTSTEEQKPETLFIRCSVVVIGIFTLASVLSVFVLPFFFYRDNFLSTLVGGILLQLLWWIYLTFCYVCGKYDQVAEKYYELDWFLGAPSGYDFTNFPAHFTLISFLLFFMLLLLGGGVYWVWDLIF
jgi:hypothetical protein